MRVDGDCDTGRASSDSPDLANARAALRAAELVDPNLCGLRKGEFLFNEVEELAFADGSMDPVPILEIAPHLESYLGEKRWETRMLPQDVDSSPAMTLRRSQHSPHDTNPCSFC